MSCILDENAVRKLIHRYDGLGKPLTSDDRELLLFALYCESEHSGGIVKLAREEEDRMVAARAEPGFTYPSGTKVPLRGPIVNVPHPEDRCGWCGKPYTSCDCSEGKAGNETT